MSKVLYIIAPQNYQDNEFEAPRDVLVSAGHDVTVASKGVSTAMGVLGGSAKVDIDVSEANADDYDAVLIAGGGGAKVFFDDSQVHGLVKSFAAGGKIVAAICISPSTLANAGLLEGKRVTAFPTEEANLKQKGAEFTGADVEVDGKTVTASGPEVAKQFGEAVANLLGEVSSATATESPT